LEKKIAAHSESIPHKTEAIASQRTFLKSIFKLLKQTASEWIDQDVSTMAAALAFYTLFAIAPLFVIVLAVAALLFGEEAARRELFSQISGLVGSEGGEAIQSLISAAHKPEAGIWATIIAVTTLFVGATGVFVQLQVSLNSIWGILRVPGRGIYNFIKDRLISFALVLGIGFILLVSLIFNVGLSTLNKFMVDLLPAHEIIWQGINFVVSFGVITLLFAIIFKVLPDVKITWGDVWLGAIITALLFNIGKHLFGLYLGRTSVASAYGAAGSIVIVLLWVYYSAQILFFGAKFTQIYSNRYGSHLETVSGAEAVP